MAKLLVVALLILLLWAFIPGFHPGNRGSKPLGDATLFLCTCFDVTLDSFSCFSSIFEG